MGRCTIVSHPVWLTRAVSTVHFHSLCAVADRVFESDIKECDKCHKKICPNCGTDITNIVGDGEDIAITFLCNECNGIDESVEAYDSSMSFMDLLDLDLDKEDE